jgi:hypothetical protein
VDNEVRQTNDEAFSRLNEEGTSSEISKVRKLLLGLPRQCCPEGFEFRLQHRLRELENGPRPLRERYNWGLGLAGLGLGLATALLVAVVAFDFSFSPTSVSIPAAPVTSATNTPPAVTTPPATNQLMASSPQQVSREAEIVPVQEQPTQMAAAKDSNASQKPPATLPEDLYHMVGGNDR